MGSRTGVGKSERTEAASPRGRASVSRVPPFSRAADYSFAFHAKRFIYSGISLKVSRCSPTLSVSQMKWRITTEAENSARGSAFVLLMEIVGGGLAGEFAQQGEFCHR